MLEALFAMPDRMDVKNMSEQGLTSWLEKRGIQAYRAGQILRWIYHRNAADFFHMTDLPKDLRRRLSDNVTISHFEPETIASSHDGSRKLLFRLSDGHHVESVLIPEREHWTLCISSQVGCAMGCAFCLTGLGGLIRNLKPSEIVNQVCAARNYLGTKGRLTNIVFMGMGEPLANYDGVLQAIRTITENNGLQFSNRRVTLSTAGLAPRIDDLGRDVTVNLAVSLNATTNDTRDALMPINRIHPIEDLLSACSRFPLPSRRMITFEYVMLAGINDSPEDAKRMAKLLHPLRAKINLIPFNPFQGCAFTRPEDEAILAFQKILIDKHYTVIIRRSKGQDVGAACGQLRAAKTRPQLSAPRF